MRTYGASFDKVGSAELEHTLISVDLKFMHSFIVQKVVEGGAFWDNVGGFIWTTVTELVKRLKVTRLLISDCETYWLDD